MKILLLEDELMLKSSIEEYLESLGHKVIAFSSGDKAKKALLSEEFDLLVLDINVPKINGFELLESIKKQMIFIPTIYISALVDIEDITKAYSLGASDYLKKPFHLKELGLRINMIADRIESEKRCHLVLSKNYCFSKDDKTLLFQGHPEKLTKKQLLILELLSANAGIVVDFDKFRSYVWNNEPIDNPSIRAEISRLRKKLKEDFIQNIKGVGYKVDRYVLS
jgi:DNA-binding response OmpR family regulator